MSKKVKLTRRRVLGGLGTIGLAGAAAGLGTSAYLNDSESFTGNSITAGTLDMSVTATVEAANDYWAGQVDLTTLEETADGEAGAGLIVDDVKPGDWGIICFDINVGDNPGYVQVSTENLVSNENDYTEPEPDTGNETAMTGDFNDPGVSDGMGELQDKILATVWHDYGDGERTSLSELDPTTNLNGSSIDSNAWSSDRDEGGLVDTERHYTTLQEAFGTYNTGVTLGGSDEPMIVGSGEDSGEFCLLLEVPSEVGNEIQGDSLSFDLVFQAEQSRNNDDPTFNSTA
ncbi:SipW-dependent-type signal peptide-containing protein [Halodesulfurarchaeum sp.]|uniref:SipW-dependent-type signal peptide-containing protein n=1 Tax=Halodesulfurarchaeum sp. TaxID=1980530 RepID=UPI001BB9AA0B|nr:SipW-dependent-type signal peptide-containing protein [Halodesulfurarchaeum sp.]